MASVTYDHVTKKFGETVAVDNLDIKVDDKEFLDGDARRIHERHRRERVEAGELIVELDLAELAVNRRLEGRAPAHRAAVVELEDHEAAVGEVLPEQPRRPVIEHQ